MKKLWIAVLFLAGCSNPSTSNPPPDVSGRWIVTGGLQVIETSDGIYSEYIFSEADQIVLDVVQNFTAVKFWECLGPVSEEGVVECVASSEIYWDGSLGCETTAGSLTFDLDIGEMWCTMTLHFDFPDKDYVEDLFLDIKLRKARDICDF